MSISETNKLRGSINALKRINGAAVAIRGEKGNSLEFIWNGTSLGVRVEGEEEYTFVDLKGQTGNAGKITIGEVITGEAGSNVEIVNTGTENEAILKIKIPRGDKGEQGIQGEKGDKGDKGDKGEQGIQGIQGEQGVQGIQGEIGPAGPIGPAGGVNSINGEKGDITGIATKEDVKEAIKNINPLPAGGTAGQVLTKNSATDGDASWKDSTGGGDEVFIGDETQAPETAKLIIDPTELTPTSDIDEIIVSPTEPVTNRRKVWMQKGKNLVNKWYKNEYYDNETIQIVPNGEFVRTDYIKIEPNTDYILSNSENNLYGWINVFDKNFNFLERLNYNNLLSSFKTTNENAEYIIANIYYRDTPNLNWIQIEQGVTATPYEAYVEPKIYIKNNNDVYEKFIEKEEDTGWQDVALKSGSGTLRYRKIGKIVNIIGVLTGINGQWQPLATLPYKPLMDTSLLIAINGNHAGTASFDAAGNLMLIYSDFNGGNFDVSNQISINHTYLVD